MRTVYQTSRRKPLDSIYIYLLCIKSSIYVVNTCYLLDGDVRTFTQVSTEWADSDSMREELDDLQVPLEFVLA